MSLLLVIAFAISSNAQDQMLALKGSDIKKSLNGKTLEGFYQFEGVLTGEQSYEETYQRDGILIYKEGDFTDKGKWWISNHQLCHNYDVDVPKIDHCFFIYKENYCYYYFESYYAQTGQMRHSEDWNNRSIIRGEGKTCELLVS
ncbi:MAG: hypothetical protein ABJN69_14950 [Hellea sp.]